MKKMRLYSFLVLLLFVNPKSFSITKDEPQQAQMEIVFVLDATGSMSGLIATAKEKIWSIASSFAQAEPAPEIKFGLVAYRDRGDVFITKIVELTDDLDHVYAELMSLNASGGGDGPESVNQGLYEAVEQMEWSKSGKVYKSIFLVGDYPPHMDYRDDVKFPASCKIANQKGIIINAIQMGNYGPTTPVWREIAWTTNGTFFHVDQNANGYMVTTPYDVALTKKSKELDATRIFYGTKDELDVVENKKLEEDKIYSESTVASTARRAIYNSSGSGIKNLTGNNELISDLINEKVEIEEIDKDLLPAEIQKMKPADLEIYIKKKIQDRQKVIDEIKELQAKRDAYIDEEIEKNPLESTFSGEVFETVKVQAASKGINLKGSAKH